MDSKTLSNASMLTGRIMLSAIFIIAGFGKIGADYAGTQAYMDSVGVPGPLLPAVIAVGIAAALLFGFTLSAALLFHSDFNQQMQSILFMKNIAIAGAFLVLYAQGPGQWALNPQPKLQEA
jgi:putative oxidoreductase